MTIEDEIRELRRLKTEASQLRHAIKAQKGVVWRHVKEAVRNLEREIRQCDNISCAVDVALRKADGAIRIFYEAHGPATQARWHWFWNLPWNKSLLSHSQVSSCRSPDVAKAQAGFSMSVQPAGDGCSPAVKDGSVAHDTWRSNSHPRLRPDHLSGGSRRHVLGLGLLLAHILIFSIIPISLAIFVLRRRSRARRADKRWRVESRRIARLVRRAHRREALRRWWTNLWRDARITDYEEKRALVLEQERTLEQAMQEEIRELRTAAEAVSSLVSSRQDSRGSALSSSTTTTPEAYETPRGSDRRNSLPDYRSEAGYSEPPPTYDDSYDSELSGTVADGFQYGSQLGSGYVAIARTATWTPDSSVVGTSIRGEVSSDEEDGGSKD